MDLNNIPLLFCYNIAVVIIGYVIIKQVEKKQRDN